MATKTGTQEERYKALAKSCLELIQGGNRTPEQTNVLLDAMQAYKGDVLDGVTLTQPKSELLKVCSERVEQGQLNKEQRRFLKSCGVRYVGEVCYLTCDVRAKASAKMISDIKTALGLPERFDPIAKGWDTPYWNDAFYEVLWMPCITFFGTFGESDVNRIHQINRFGTGLAASKTYARRLHAGGVHYMMDYLRRSSRPGNVNDLKEKQRDLRAGKADLWAAAIAHPEATSERLKAPHEWTEEQQRIAQEIDEYETPKAWVVSANTSAVHIYGAYVRYPGEDITSAHMQARRFSWRDGKVWYRDTDIAIEVGGPVVDVREFSSDARAFATQQEADTCVNELRAAHQGVRRLHVFDHVRRTETRH